MARCGLFAFTCLTLTLAPALALAGGSVGFHRTTWSTDSDAGEVVGVDARLELSRRVGFAVGYLPRRSDVPDPGFATLPDVTAELVIAPLPNRYFSPYVTLGVGVARYADERLSALGGVGAQVELTSWLVVFGQWRVIAPGPLAVAGAVEERRTQELMTGTEPMPIGDLLSEHYNARNAEVTFGYRLGF